jgi:hypothetical protein
MSLMLVAPSTIATAIDTRATPRFTASDGQARYPHARRLLICAGSGGSNAARSRAWVVHIARLAAGTGLEITVCHYPPGTSKWNKVEHRLFAQITRNRRGRPLVSHQAIIELISATTTTTGLTVHAELDTNKYCAAAYVPMILEWLDDRYGHSSFVPASDDANRTRNGG